MFGATLWNLASFLKAGEQFVDPRGATQQIVGRERNQRACHRQLVRNAVVSRRVNSTVKRPT